MAVMGCTGADIIARPAYGLRVGNPSRRQGSVFKIDGHGMLYALINKPARSNRMASPLCNMNISNYNFRMTLITVLSFLSGGLGPSVAQAAVPNGAAPMLTALKIHTPAGNVVEASTTDDSLRSIALDVILEADANGVGWFTLEFESPKGTRVYFEGYGNSAPDVNPLKPADLRKQTYTVNKSGFYAWSPWVEDPQLEDTVEDIDQVGIWRLVGAQVIGGNGEWRGYGSNGEDPLPAGIQTSFRVTRHYSQQPSHLSIAPGGNITLSPVLSAAQTGATFQWYRNGKAIPKATMLRYSKTGALATDAGLYQLEMTVSGLRVRTDSVVVSLRTSNVQLARDAIKKQNGQGASTYSARAVAEKPSSSEALFVSAMSALYNVLSDSRTGQSLKALGLQLEMKFPLDSSGVQKSDLLSSASSATVTTWIDQVLIPGLQKASGHMAKITDRNFVTYISASDFAGWGWTSSDSPSLIVDYGDIQMAQTLLSAISSLVNLASSINTNFQVGWMESTSDQGKLSMQAILSKYPALLSAAPNGTAKQRAAVQSLGKIADAYLNFSEFMYNRSGKASARRLVTGDRNLFPAFDLFEQNSPVTPYSDLLLRDYAANVKLSLAVGPRPFIAEHSFERGVVSRYRVNLKAIESRPAGIRSSFPVFLKNQALGAVAQPTFNGVLPDLTSAGLKARFYGAQSELDQIFSTK